LDISFYRLDLLLKGMKFLKALTVKDLISYEGECIYFDSGFKQLKHLNYLGLDNVPLELEDS
jgi:hypothetical protein